MYAHYLGCPWHIQRPGLAFPGRLNPAPSVFSEQLTYNFIQL